MTMLEQMLYQYLPFSSDILKSIRGRIDILIALTIVLGTVIIINQIRIRKQLHQIQERLEEKTEKET